jgi:hypothetical protein
MLSLPEHLTDVMGGGGGVLLVSAAFRALPEPTEKSGGFYQWFYRFGNILFAAKTTPPAAKPVATSATPLAPQEAAKRE